jgi:hypothetical protein
MKRVRERETKKQRRKGKKGMGRSEKEINRSQR